MSKGKDRSTDFGWTLSQRRVLLALLAIFLAVLWIRLAFNGTYVPDPQAPQGARATELASRVDPNSADWQTLATIPTLGEKRARAIVGYRERMWSNGSTSPAFQRATDLLHIRGIGIATMENIKPYLIFPAEPASTSP